MWQSVCQTDKHIERPAGSKDYNKTEKPKQQKQLQNLQQLLQKSNIEQLQQTTEMILNECGSFFLQGFVTRFIS